MPIRLATPTDAPSLASICTAAWFDDTLFGTLIHPYRHQYPVDVAIFWYEAIRENFAAPDEIMLVTTTTEHAVGKLLV